MCGGYVLIRYSLGCFSETKWLNKKGLLLSHVKVQADRQDGIRWLYLMSSFCLALMSFRCCLPWDVWSYHVYMAIPQQGKGEGSSFLGCDSGVANT